MNTLVIYHPDIFLHDTHANHGAMAHNRINLVFQAVSSVPGVQLREAKVATREQILRNHDEKYYDRLVQKAPSAAGEVFVVALDTEMNQHTLRALQLSAGAMCEGVDAVIDGDAGSVFCPVYAGHHAEPDKGGGFCFINSAAIAAHHALHRGLKQIALLDFDTHSGNGSVLSFMNKPEVMVAETYQPGYPGPFMPGYCPDNIVRKKCAAPYQFRDAWKKILPRVSEFAPEMIIISAGFDAHKDDPLGLMRLSDEDYIDLARAIKNICPKIVACLEGGYNTQATPRCAALFVKELVGSENT